MKNTTKYLGTIILSAGLLFGATACGGDDKAAEEAAAAQTAADEKLLTAEHAVAAIEEFFNATTSDEVAAAFAEDTGTNPFADAVQFTDPEAEDKLVGAAMADLALVKVFDEKAVLSIEVDESKVVIDGRKATVPVEAISVLSGEKPVADSAVLADVVNDLVFRDGAWLITFPAAPEASAAPSESAAADSKK